MTAHSPLAGPALPAGLRERVMTASHQTRPAGRAVPAVSEDSPAEAFAHIGAVLVRLVRRDAGQINRHTVLVG